MKRLMVSKEKALPEFVDIPAASKIPKLGSGDWIGTPDSLFVTDKMGTTSIVYSK